MPAARANEANKIANSLHFPLRHASTSGPVSVSVTDAPSTLINIHSAQGLDGLQRIGLAPGHLAGNGDDPLDLRLDVARLAQVTWRTPAPRSAVAPTTITAWGASIRTTARYWSPS